MYPTVRRRFSPRCDSDIEVAHLDFNKLILGFLTWILHKEAHGQADAKHGTWCRQPLDALLFTRLIRVILNGELLVRTFNLCVRRRSTHSQDFVKVFRGSLICKKTSQKAAQQQNLHVPNTSRDCPMKLYYVDATGGLGQALFLHTLLADVACPRLGYYSLSLQLLKCAHRWLAHGHLLLATCCSFSDR